mmetsp:Transcript_12293/g.18326  ORF Transcript_12293/g.18326 Transcript_12293/m.18326 type:complete len:386 (+) Transcript_12293:114-1271(+)|eukprot:CAMPEP_0167753916 /NCGR_PEP_ID=MMETSP0110_2-20121227/7981_1 /TAXON_ID=629695 /ORGANISM="Gymnochlora sp., Strain CCMP2014" /LENGTH=385 /DNA_ID=CAMNT_0007639739 /DNA_START=98 /DNA_END=1255 /DNA_ORIENTATION=+
MTSSTSHAIHSLYKGVAEYFTPVLTSSSFKEKGVVTPEEFVKAGDQLVFKCRTWQWAPGKPSMIKNYLPPGKQFLITRNVPSLKRATDYALQDAKEAIIEENGKLGDGWVSTHVKEGVSNDKKEEKQQIASIEGSQTQEKVAAIGATGVDVEKKELINGGEKVQQKVTETADDVDEDDEIPDMDDFEEDNLEEADPGMLLTDNIIENKVDAKSKPAPEALKIGKGAILRVEEPEDNIERTRTYDISITYDKYYRTPRIFLFGYDRDRQPLTPKQIMEDISADHANKTVTVDPHPHLEVPHASIHPCKHAPVMLRICERMEEGNVRKLIEAKKESAKKKGIELKEADLKLTEKEAESCGIKIDQYMFLFLKFISSVIPTIEYDYTV